MWMDSSYLMFLDLKVNCSSFIFFFILLISKVLQINWTFEK